MFKRITHFLITLCFTLLLVGCSVSSEPKLAPSEQINSTVILKEVPIAGAIGVKTSGGYLWAWSGNEIWRYTRGEWSWYATSPADELPDVEYAFDTLWIAGNGLWYLEGEKWQELAEAPLDALWIEADDQNDILWVSDFSNLYRWNGEEMTDVGQPSSINSCVWKIAVTGDGMVWAGGLDGFLPTFGGLARYDDAAGSWEMVRPWRVDEDVPARILTTTPNGSLWAVLVDFPEDWEKLEDAGKPYFELSLVHQDGVTGEWSVFEEDLPLGLDPTITANDEVIWLAERSGMIFDGLSSFDGENWSHYLPGEVIEDIAIAPDESIWYIAAD